MLPSAIVLGLAAQCAPGVAPETIAAIVQTVRLIRSKGVGVFFVTQTPKDVPADVLGQLGSRVQHALRAFTPDDAKALRATVGTYPKSGYDLERVLQELGTGEAIVTVMSEKGAPTPVAWTRLRAPESLMAAADATAMGAQVKASPLFAKYAETVDRESAREILAGKLEAGAAKAEAEQAAKDQPKEPKPAPKAPAGRRKQEKSMVEEVVTSTTFRQVMRTAAREIVRGVFGTGRR